MKKMKTKILSFILAAITILSIIPCTVGAAAITNPITPQWKNTAAVSCKIGFIDGYGYAEAYVMGHTNANKISGDVYVYRQEGSSWVYVDEEHKTVNSCSLALSCQFDYTEGEYYRADYTFTVTKNGVDEVITQTKYRTA